jgi:cytochrome oxidase Cu insertion factor (SCO1/SenC/PrrC family)
MNDLRRRNLRTVAALAALFFLPLLLSFTMYYGGWGQPAQRSNYGELLEPIRTLPLRDWPQAAPLLGQWTLLHVSTASCAQDCQQALDLMYKTRVLLNKDMQRVNVALLSAAAPGKLSELVFLDTSANAAATTLALLPARDLSRSIFLIDPLGNLVLRHDTRSNPKGLLQDLKKLLKLSHIG